MIMINLKMKKFLLKRKKKIFQFKKRIFKILIKIRDKIEKFQNEEKEVHIENIQKILKRKQFRCHKKLMI